MNENQREFQISPCLTKNFYLTQKAHNATNIVRVRKRLQRKSICFSFQLNTGHSFNNVFSNIYSQNFSNISSISGYSIISPTYIHSCCINKKGNINCLQTCSKDNLGSLFLNMDLHIYYFSNFCKSREPLICARAYFRTTVWQKDCLTKIQTFHNYCLSGRLSHESTQIPAQIRRVFRNDLTSLKT